MSLKLFVEPENETLNLPSRRKTFSVESQSETIIPVVGMRV